MERKHHHLEPGVSRQNIFPSAIASPQQSVILPKGAIDALCGSLGGIASILLGHPLDTAKVRLQSAGTGAVSIGVPVGTGTKGINVGTGTLGVSVGTGIVNVGARHSTPILQPLPHYYRGTWDCLSKTYRCEGARGLYKGVLPPLLGASFTSATMFYTYNHVARRLCTREFSLLPHVAGGAISGFVNAFLDTPLELVKSKMQVSQSTGHGNVPVTNRWEQYRGSVHCASQILKNFGARGLFQGLSVTVVRNVLGGAIYWSVYEYLKHHLQVAWVYASDFNELSKLTRRDSAAPMVIVGASAVAGGVCCVGNYWLDAVKSCVQVDVSERSKRRFGTWPQYLRDMLRQRGVQGIYAGCSAALMRSGVGVSCFLVYEWASKHLNKE